MQDILNIQNIFQTKSLAIATDVYLSEKLAVQFNYDIEELKICNSSTLGKLKEVEIGLSHDVVLSDEMINTVVMNLLNACVELHHLYQYFIRDIDQLIARLNDDPEFKVDMTTQYLGYMRSGASCFRLIDRLKAMYEHRITHKQSRALEWMLSGRCIGSYRCDYEFYRSMLRGNNDYQSKIIKREDAKHKIEVYLPLLLCSRNQVDITRSSNLFTLMPREQAQSIRVQTNDAADAIVAAGANYAKYVGSLNTVLGLDFSCCIHVTNQIGGLDHLEIFLEKGVFWNFAKGTVEIDLNINTNTNRNFISGLLTSLTLISVNYHDVYFANIDEFYCSRFI